MTNAGKAGAVRGFEIDCVKSGSIISALQGIMHVPGPPGGTPHRVEPILNAAVRSPPSQPGGDLNRTV